MRLWTLLLMLTLWPALAPGQSSVVSPGELHLEIELTEPDLKPVQGEMVMITIRGTYRRHITRETLAQPGLEGFNWSQLGPDAWSETRIDGKKVKVFERQMALYPNRPGLLTIGAFTHNLTLTDEGDDWFDHTITSEPLTITVAPIPEGVGTVWWFPVRRLEVSDQWSNPPDQLEPGAGVLRVIRIEALGATPEMIPPMPVLNSPSGMVFAHPEKRLVELTPQGPVTYAFWRWTIRPGNDNSAILEPLLIDYFNTATRQMGQAEIVPQRVAYRASDPALGGGSDPVAANRVVATPADLPGRGLVLMAALVFAVSLAAVSYGRRFESLAGLQRHYPGLDPLAWRLRRAAWQGKAADLRRAADAMLRRDGADPARVGLVSELDRALFAARPTEPPLTKWAHRFLRAAGKKASCKPDRHL